MTSALPLLPTSATTEAAAMRTEAPYYLRALLTIDQLGADQLAAPQPELWARVLDGWTFSPTHDAARQLTAQAAEVVRLVRREDRGAVEAGLLVLAHYPHSSTPNPLLVSRVAGTGAAGERTQLAVRVFSRDLTELEALTERLARRLMQQPQLRVDASARVLVAIVTGGAAYDLTSGRLRLGRRSVLGGFYSANREVLSVTSGVLVFTLAVVLLVVPSGPYSALGKFYGVVERVLSAVMLNVLLLFSQFLFWLRHREVIEWEKP